MHYFIKLHFSYRWNSHFMAHCSFNRVALHILYLYEELVLVFFFIKILVVGPLPTHVFLC